MNTSFKKISNFPSNRSFSFIYVTMSSLLNVLLSSSPSICFRSLSTWTLSFFVCFFSLNSAGGHNFFTPVWQSSSSSLSISTTQDDFAGGHNLGRLLFMAMVDSFTPVWQSSSSSLSISKTQDDFAGGHNFS